MRTNPTILMPASKNYADLSGLFSPAILNSLFNKNPSVSAKKTVRKSRLLTEYYEETIELQQLFRFAYNILKENYRSEYIYKNSLINNLLRERHILKNSVFIPEFNVGNSKADIAAFNGTSTVYEIKSELDNTGKLTKQLSSYLNVFDKVYLLTHEQLASKMIKQIDPRVGVIIMTSGCQFNIVKEATSNKAYVDPLSIFNCLRRGEYLWILKELFDFIPNVSSAKMVTLCKNIFEELDSRTAHDFMVRVIVNHRKLNEDQTRLINNTPSSLKMLAISRSFNRKQCLILSEALKTAIKI